ncbi:GNAT family N-acetyltransferase [Paenibacillus puerhi]|uniref:GNAT family N-acetyltransferase n=1 Tax=Paenibacillus puerhi TaxID=2692622 RepID=UPI0013568055|nr:GNAT family protein [Paenibacillus puerhi]
MPHLIGDRIILREYRKDDLIHLRTWVNDPKVVDNLSDVFLYPHTMNSTEAYLNSVLEGKGDHKGFIIAHKESEEYIGQIDLFKFDWKNRCVEMGIVIGCKEDQGRGYGSEAIMLLQEFVFDRVNLNRLQLEVHDYNQQAINCYKKCGFIEEGRLRQRHFINGKYSDTVYMGILQSDYQARIMKI